MASDNGENGGAGDASSLLPPRPLGDFNLAPTSTGKRRALQWASWSFIFIAIALTIVLAVIGGSQSAAVSAIIAFISGLLQISSVLASFKSGAIDVNLARSLARRWRNIGTRAQASTQIAEQAFSDVRAGEVAQAQLNVGLLSSGLDVIQESIGEMLETWQDLYPDIFADQPENAGSENGQD